MATRTGLERQPITNGVVDRVTFQFFSEEEVGRRQPRHHPDGMSHFFDHHHSCCVSASKKSPTQCCLMASTTHCLAACTISHSAPMNPASDAPPAASAFSTAPATLATSSWLSPPTTRWSSGTACIFSCTTHVPSPHSVLLRLLRAVCLHCFRFRMAHETLQRYAHRLKLVAEGRLVEAMGAPVRKTLLTAASVLATNCYMLTITQH